MKDEKVVVLGIGNLLLGDEGVGVHAVRALEKMALDSEIELIDGGTSPEILPYLQTAQKLIIIDAMDTSDKPGSIYRFRLDELKTEPEGLASAHDIGLLTQINMMRMAGRKIPEAVLLGVQPKNIDWGMELSPEVEASLPRVAELVIKEVPVSSTAVEAN